jgi:hypothetical protein
MSVGIIGILRLRLFFALVAQRTILAQDDNGESQNPDPKPQSARF